MFLDIRCPGCDRGYWKLGSPVCSVCVLGFGPPVRLQIPGILETVAGALHEGAARQMVLAGKSQGRTAVLTQLGRAVIDSGNLQRWAEVYQVVTWVPGSPANVRARGYDQGQVLARAVATKLGLPTVRLFRRSKGLPQTGLGRQERRLGPQLAVVASAPTRVILVDDVITTGVSMRVAAGHLHRNGAESVVATSLTTRLRRETS